MLFLAPSQLVPEGSRTPSANCRTRGAGPRCATEGREAGNHGRPPAPRRVTLAARESRIGQVGGTCGRPAGEAAARAPAWTPHRGASTPPPQARPAARAFGGAPRGAARRGRAPGSANSAATARPAPGAATHRRSLARSRAGG